MLIRKLREFKHGARNWPSAQTQKKKPRTKAIQDLLAFFISQSDFPEQERAIRSPSEKSKSAGEIPGSRRLNTPKCL
jgi:hypothetical protein